MSLPTLGSSPRQDCLTSEFQPLSQYHVGDKFISVIFGELVISAAKIEKRKGKKTMRKNKCGFFVVAGCSSAQGHFSGDMSLRGTPKSSRKMASALAETAVAMFPCGRHTESRGVRV